jgi:Fur family ferric uptake transcriptional regulator
MSSTTTRPASTFDTVSLQWTEQDKFISAMEIHHALWARGEHAGLITVYRSLRALVDNAQVDVILDSDGQHRYRRCSPTAHHHLACQRCHRTVEIYDSPLDHPPAAQLRDIGFALSTVRVSSSASAGSTRQNNASRMNARTARNHACHLRRRRACATRKYTARSYVIQHQHTQHPSGHHRVCRTTQTRVDSSHAKPFVSADGRFPSENRRRSPAYRATDCTRTDRRGRTTIDHRQAEYHDDQPTPSSTRCGIDAVLVAAMSSVPSEGTLTTTDRRRDRRCPQYMAADWVSEPEKQPLTTGHAFE